MATLKRSKHSIKTKKQNHYKSKNKKTNQYRKNQQMGGDGKMPPDMPEKIIATTSFKNILTQAQNTTPATNIQQLQERYSNNKILSRHLVDIIYNLPQLGQTWQSIITLNQQLKLGWDHGTGNPASITAGLPGIHVYITESSAGANDWQLLGVFIRQNS